MARDVNLCVGLVHDIGTQFGEAIDDTVDRVLVAGDQTLCEDDSVALADLDLVLHVGHAREHRHRLTLATR